MIFANRKNRGPDPHLDWKIRLFFIGAVLALTGIAVNSNILVGLALVVLLLGMVLRFLPGGDVGEEFVEDDDEKMTP